jgi:hypothetical protein
MIAQLGEYNMKTGRSLQELLKEVVRQQESKRDFIASTDHLSVVPQADDIRLQIGSNSTATSLDVGINDHAHNQIGSHTKIPAQYYDRMRREDPNLLAINVNAWFRKDPQPRMVRTLDNKARGFLSDRFRPLDNTDLLEAALPPLMEMGVDVMSCEVTDQKLYLKVVDQRIKRDLPVGVVLGRGHTQFDTVSPALVLSNSEVGAGALAVQTSVWTGGCSNLMIIKERSVRKYHVGGRHELGDEIYRMLSDNTKRLTDAALWAQLKDVVSGAFDVARFDAQVDKLKVATQEKIEGDPIKVVEITAKKWGLDQTEKNSVLQNLIRSGDFSKYGLHAAVTRAAEDVVSYDRASQLEALGGEIVELSKSDWREITVSAKQQEALAA